MGTQPASASSASPPPSPLPPPIGAVARARSEAEAAWMLAEGREGTRVIAGGTDLMLQIERGRFAPVALVDVRRSGMDEMRLRDDALVIGATATASALARWPRLREHAASLWEAASTLSVPQIRNLATLGGNLCNASPAADMVPPVLAMDGIVHVRRGDSLRQLAADDLATGPGHTKLGHDELLVSVEIPRWAPGAFHHFVKLGFRDAQIIALTSLALSVELEDDHVKKVGIALGSVAPRVVRAHAVETFLLGKRLTREVGHEAMALLARDISPIDDIRSQGAYRLQVAQNYLGDALTRAHLHHQGQDVVELRKAPKGVLRFLQDPAPRPPSIAAKARTTVLGDLGIKAHPLRVVSTSKGAYERKAVAKKPSAKKPASKRPSTKKATGKGRKR